MKRLILAVLTGAALAASPTNAFAQSAKEVRGASPLNAIENEPALKLIVDPPLPDQLARGLFAFDAPNLLVTAYPLVMVPTFAVPLALILHGLVLWRLRETPAAGRLVAA